MFKIEEICFFSNKEETCIQKDSYNALVLNFKLSLNHLIRFFIKKDGLSNEELEIRMKINLSNERQLIIPSNLKGEKDLFNTLNDFNHGESMYVHKNNRGIYYLTKDGIKVTDKEELLKISEWSDNIFSMFILKLIIIFKKHKEWSETLPLYKMEINNLKILFLDNPLIPIKIKKIEEFLTKQTLKNSDYIFVSSFWMKHPIFNYNKIENVLITDQIYSRIIDEFKPSDKDKEILEELLTINGNFTNPKTLSLYVGIEEEIWDNELLDKLIIQVINADKANKLDVKDLVSLIISKSDNSYLRIILEKLLISKELFFLQKENISLKDEHERSVKQFKRNFEKWKANTLTEIDKLVRETIDFIFKK